MLALKLGALVTQGEPGLQYALCTDLMMTALVSKRQRLVH